MACVFVVYGRVRIVYGVYLQCRDGCTRLIDSTSTGKRKRTAPSLRTLINNRTISKRYAYAYSVSVGKLADRQPGDKRPEVGLPVTVLPGGLPERQE